MKVTEKRELLGIIGVLVDLLGDAAWMLAELREIAGVDKLDREIVSADGWSVEHCLIGTLLWSIDRARADVRREVLGKG
ncbi:MAG: hypothetical protein LBI92_06795 [Azoarcus sp.]|jgi:hypothetical protein|nr:hypothetical protein [Azoarcus sp.]